MAMQYWKEHKNNVGRYSYCIVSVQLWNIWKLIFGSIK